MRCIQFFSLVAALITATPLALYAESVETYHYDNVASGVDPNETLLAPANLTVSTFSKSFAVPVDGQVYAQPLYVPNVNVVGGPQAGTHNLALVATQHDSLYAIDVQSGVIVWQSTFVATGLSGATTITSMPSGDSGTTDSYPEIGICGTPVIDPTNNRYLYLAAKTKQILNGDTVDPHYVYTLYQIDITNGNATANANIVASTIIGNTTYTTTTGSYTYNTASSPTAAQDIFVPGTGDGAITVNGQSRVYFNAMRQMNRPAMLLYNGNLYIGFGSHGDNGPYHGWLLSYSEATLTLNGVLNTSPNAGESGIWGGGAKPVVDANGNIYVMTGNGTFDGYNNNGVTAGLNSLGFPVNGDYGDSFLKVAVDPTTSVGNQSTNGWGLRVTDYFSPSNSASLNSADTDLGGGGMTLLPTSAGSSAHPNLAVGAGKQGNIYLLDTSSLGKFSATTDNVVQEQVALNECTSTPAFFNGVLYYACNNDNGKAFTISNATMSTTPVTTPDIFGFPGSTPTVSANGINNGIVWMIDRSTATLRAYSAANLNNEIWTSALAPNSRDQLGTVAKFTTPTVADGNVLVGTASNFVVYSGPTTASGPPGAPTNLVATDISSLQINLSWTDNTTNEAQYAIEESTDGVNFSQIGTAGVDVTNYAVTTNLQSGTTYYFRVRSFNNYNTLSYSAYTNIANATTLASAPTLNFLNGFAGSTSTLQYNGSAAIVNNAAQITGLTPGDEAGSVWSLAPQNVQAFVTEFTFQLTSPTGDGCTFSLQNNNPSALGGDGGNLGYGGITKSIAIKFDLFNNTSEGPNSTGLFTNGASPYTPATDLTSSGINLHSGDVMAVTLLYNGTVLTETITDTVTSATTTLNYTINIPATIGSNTAYAGFTGGTGSDTAQQDILGWTYSPLATTAPAAPSNLVAAAASGTQINLTWTDNSNNESGFVIMRATGSTGTYAQAGVVGAGVTTYSDTGLNPNVTYYYQVYATNNVGNSADSNTAYALTPVPPATPTNAQATAITSTSISMSWTNNATNATAYNIFRKMTSAANFSEVATLPATATTYTDTGLAPGTSYDYHIQAYNLAGYSDFSGFTAVTLAGGTLPIVTVTSTTGAVAVSGVATGQLTFTCNSAPAANFPINYTISGTGVAGSDYTALSGSATIPAGATSVTVPVTALAGATPNATVIASIATTASYEAGTPASATVVLEPTTYNASAQTTYGTSTVAGTTGNSVTLTFQGLPGSPAGTVYVWYYNGAAFATTTTGSYTISNALASQSGTYSVYAYAPGGVTGSASFTVTVSGSSSTSSFTDADIGGPSPAGSASVSSGVYTVSGGGADIYGAADQFNFYSEPTSGNAALIVQVTSQQNTSVWAKAGLMFRNSSAAGDAWVGVFQNPGGLVEMQWRDTANAQANWPGSQITTGAAVNWLELVKTGNSFSAYYATTTGVPAANNWTLIATHTTTFTNSTFLAGLAVTSHNNGVLGSAVFSNFTYPGSSTAPTLPIVTVSSSSGPLAVSGIATGQITFTTNTAPTANLPITYTISGTGVAGSDYTTLSGTATIPAGATSVTVPVTAATGATPNATVIASIATTSTYQAGTPASATVVLEPTTFNASAQTTYGTSSVAGTTGNSVTLTFQGLPGSPAGTVYIWYYNGTAIATTSTGSYTISNALASQSGTYSVYAYAPGGVTGSASFTVTVTASTSTSSFTDADIGGPSPAGSASVSSGVYTVSGGGADIYGASDQFNFYSESATGNGTLIVQVTSQQNTSVWAKAGLMFRNSSAAGDAWVGVFQNPGGLVEMQWRDTANAQANWTGSQITTGATVNWLELIKTGNSFSAYYATTTGVPATNNWILIATHTTAFVNSTFLAGLAVTSHNNGVLGSATFANFTYPGGSSAPTLPVVTLSSSTAPVAVYGVATGEITFTINSALTASLPITYTVSGTASPGAAYTALSGATTIPAGTTSVSVPVSALPGATSNTTVTASVATTSTYQAGTVSSATVVLEPTTFNATAQNAYGTGAVAGSTGGTVTLTFGGLPGNPTGTFYVWYYNGTAFTTTTTGAYSLTNAQISQSGTYSVYAYAPGGVTGSETYTVTITTATTSSFTDADIGSPSPAGSASVSSGVYTVSGGGADIYGASDQFNFYSESATGNGTLIAQVTSQTNTSVWAKAGLMFRNSTAAGDAWVGVFQNPGGLVELQWRDTSGAQANWPGSQVTTGATVNWLELVKTGNSYSAYYATTTGVPAANNWILIATHTTTFVNSTFLAGLAVTSHNNGVLGTATFANFTHP